MFKKPSCIQRYVLLSQIRGGSSTKSTIRCDTGYEIKKWYFANHAIFGCIHKNLDFGTEIKKHREVFSKDIRFSPKEPT